MVSRFATRFLTNIRSEKSPVRKDLRSVHAFQKPSATHGAKSNKCTKIGESPTSTLLGREVPQAGISQGGSVNKLINPNTERRYKWAVECGSLGNQHSTHAMSILRHFAMQHSSVLGCRLWAVQGPQWRCWGRERRSMSQAASRGCLTWRQGFSWTRHHVYK